MAEPVSPGVRHEWRESGSDARRRRLRFECAHCGASVWARHRARLPEPLPGAEDCCDVAARLVHES